ncbi:amidohydrolase [Phenylobacterium sp.]|jgi:predicted amidohydrolase YtcJ|uniref:amidohydrolase n=1 Tax=Phenylobacterium sp. TaxID=1871053 RepID=UPI003783A527
MRRRDFITGAAGAGLAGPAMAQQLASTVVKQKPDLGTDLAILNGRIWTMDPSRPRAQAALVRAGRIVHVGSNAEVQGMARGVRRIDAGGRTVVPGFIDSHTHLEIASYYYAGLQSDVHSPPMTSVPQILGVLRAQAARTEPGRWVIGRGSFGLQNLLAEKRFPTRLELDTVSERHPVVFMGGFHGWSMNTMAFKMLKLWDPAEAREIRWRDGRRKVGTDVARDADGRPTGVVTETFDLIPNDAHTYAEKREALRTQVVPNFSSKGITSVVTIPLFDDDMPVVQELQAQGQLPMRVRYYPTVPAMISLESVRQFALSPGFGDDMLRFGGIKIFVAGAGYDAALKPVTDLKWTQEELDDVVWRAHKQGLQILMHQAGDSLRNTLAAVEKAQARLPRDLRHRLEHYSTLTPEEMVRMRRLGMKVAITAPNGRGARPAGWAAQPVPRYRTMIEQGLEPVAISDATGTVPFFSPMLGIGGMVASPQEGGSAPAGQSPDLEDAIRMFTQWAANSIFEGDAKGSITPGKLGDFAILDRDLTTTKAADLFDVKVDATVLGGRPIFER